MKHRNGIVVAGIVLGVGLGGFLDGILLHQLLQWHNMLSSRVPPVDLVSMKYNMVWDGAFHVFAWLVTCIGIALLWRARREPDSAWSARAFVGALAVGWSLFNVIEGVIDHQILGVHHVHGEVDQMAWDVGFLVGSLLLGAIGAWLILAQRSQKALPPLPSPAH